VQSSWKSVEIFTQAMRVLALDHGTKRMGIAISDELGMIAQPLEFIPAEPFAEFLDRLNEIIRTKQVELILVGMPRNMDGSYGPAALKVQEFVAVLKDAMTIPIQTLDERLTSVQAHRFLTEAEVSGRQRKGKVDKSAAAVLLQSYLDGCRTG
jgi:putative Holliday junction resolvase